MPWNVSGMVEQRKGFLVEWESVEYSMTECCARHGISRQTGYELLRRYRQWGEPGLAERGRAAHLHPNQTPVALYEPVLELRRAHPRWGPRKLKVRLERLAPEQAWPAVSTIGAILKREGLVVTRRRNRRTPPYTQPWSGPQN